jgi:GNAT superfamily N-acetyltransferase
VAQYAPDWRRLFVAQAATVCTAAMTCVLRPATAADIPAMHRVRLSVRENVLRDLTKVTDADYAQRLLAGDGAWVCETDGAVIGFAFVDLAQRNVWALFVAPKFEGQGVGRHLHDTMLDWAFSHDVAEIGLSTEYATRAATFYERAGWEFVRDLGNGDGEYRMTRGRWRSFHRQR